MSDRTTRGHADCAPDEKVAIEWLIRAAESEIESMQVVSSGRSLMREAERRLRSDREASIRRRQERILLAGRAFAIAAVTTALLFMLVASIPRPVPETAGPAEMIAALAYPVTAFVIPVLVFMASAIARLRSS